MGSSRGVPVNDAYLAIGLLEVHLGPEYAIMSDKPYDEVTITRGDFVVTVPRREAMHWTPSQRREWVRINVLEAHREGQS
jgi:hypothetical protein